VSAGPACTNCGAVLASDQEFCLECGAQQLPAPETPWRVPVLAATVTVLIAALALVFAYSRLRDQAEDDAGRTIAPAREVRPGPSGPPAAPDAAQPPPLVPLAPEATGR
jgi:hypothetical protein